MGWGVVLDGDKGWLEEEKPLVSDTVNTELASELCLGCVVTHAVD